MATKAPEPRAEEADSKAAADAKPAPAKGGIMSTVISSLIMAVILGGVGFALAYFVLPSRLQQAAATTAPDATTNAASATPPAAPAAGEKTERTPAEIAAQGNKAVTKFTIEEVTVNIADTRGNRFVRAGVYFEASPAVLEELEAMLI